MQGQSPQLAVPEGCRGRPGAQVKKHLVLVRMLSCRCQAQTSKTVPLGKKLNLSGATYDLNVLAKTRFGRSTIQKWHLPAQELTETRALNVSVGGNMTSMQWAAQAPGTTYCLEWQPWFQHRNHTHCTLIVPEEEDPAKMVTHSWSSKPTLEQEECYRITVFASKNPKNPMLWATVLSSYYFGGNASRAGTPRHVSVRNQTGDSVSVEWTASQLSTCPGVLTQYVVRCEAEDGAWESEWLVPPTKTQVTLDGLRSRVMYKVQVRADTARLPGAWSHPQRFSFGPPGTCAHPCLHPVAALPWSSLAARASRLGSGATLRTSRRCCTREMRWWSRCPETEATGQSRPRPPLSAPWTQGGPWRLRGRGRCRHCQRPGAWAWLGRTVPVVTWPT